MLESLAHPASFFFTLTYDQEHYPNDGNLQPAEISKFIKRARYYSDQRIRYFVCGEYGSRTQRAHYHGIFFGTADHSIVSRAWRYGFVSFGSVTPSSIAYVGGYVTKKLTGSYYRQQNKVPEFARMSLNPGIGRPGLERLIEFLTSEQGAKLIAETGDVPAFVRWNQQKWPLGRYLRMKLREAVGFDKIGTPEVVLASVAGERAAHLEMDLEHYDKIRVQDGYIAEARQSRLRLREKL
ncbi:MAG: hypothetical protein QXT77_07795 [Candidatus Methanomethylicaceae archaeon]